jgi:hypothetical protein
MDQCLIGPTRFIDSRYASVRTGRKKRQIGFTPTLRVKLSLWNNNLSAVFLISSSCPSSSRAVNPSTAPNLVPVSQMENGVMGKEWVGWGLNICAGGVGSLLGGLGGWGMTVSVSSLAPNAPQICG